MWENGIYFLKQILISLSPAFGHNPSGLLDKAPCPGHTLASPPRILRKQEQTLFKDLRRQDI